MVQIIPLTSFVHGSVDAHAGRPQMVDADIAAELSANGLVRISNATSLLHAGKLTNLPVVGDAGKAQDDGRGQPSSVLPAAPASRTKTLPPSKPGVTKPRRAVA